MATTEDAGQAMDAAEKVFPPFDPSTFASQLFWLVIAFGITYYVISKIAAPRISAILEDRYDRIASDLAEADRLKRETEEAMASYEGALADARSKAQALASETRDKLTAETTAKRQESEAELNKKLAEADARIASIKTEALSQVDQIASESVEAIMSKLSPTQPSKTDIGKVVAELGDG